MSKERFNCYYCSGIENIIVEDTINNKTYIEDNIVNLLNQQDKRIKELEQENLSLQEQSIRDNQNWIEETTQLKQQLHDLPKKIIDEIEKSFTEYLPLNAILKKVWRGLK